MGRKVFVGGLPWAVTNEDLRDAFSVHGTVMDAKVILDLDTGRSRGFGFVTFDSDSAAEKAIREMHGSTMGSRTINVSEAQDRRGSDRRGPSDSGNRSGSREERSENWPSHSYDSGWGRGRR